MLDEALLRPGRLEVQVEIGLADEKGRHQILKVCLLPGQYLQTLHSTDCRVWPSQYHMQVLISS